MATAPTQGIAPGQYSPDRIHDAVFTNLRKFKEIEEQVGGAYTPIKSLPKKAKTDLRTAIGAKFDINGSTSLLVQDAANIRVGIKRIKKDKRKLAALGGAEKAEIILKQADVMEQVGKAQLALKKKEGAINDAFKGPAKAIFDASVAMAKIKHPDGQSLALQNFQILDELGFATLQEGKGKHGQFIAELQTQVSQQANDPDILPFVAATGGGKAAKGLADKYNPADLLKGAGKNKAA